MSEHDESTGAAAGIPDAVATDSATERAGILPGEHLRALGARLHGELFLPGDAGWDEARRPWALAVPQAPAAVVIAADEDDVAETLRSARKLGLRVAPQGTGHGAGALPDLSDAILLRISRLSGVVVDPTARTARVGAGAVWADVAAAAAQHGLAAVSGMGPSVGVAGFLLGGGLGWLARSHGLGSRSLRAIEGVDAQGRLVRADATENSDLLWAARGGTAPIVLTALELQLHEVGTVWAGGLLWPIERTAEVVTAWREWTAALPDSVTSLVRVLRYPPIPQIPEAVRGRAFVAVEAAIQADQAEVSSLLAPLRALEPELDSMRPMAPAELGSVHGDPTEPAPSSGDAALLTELTADALDALVAAALQPAAEPLLSIEVRHLGGALAPGAGPSEGDELGGAVETLPGQGLVFAVGIVPAPELLPVVRAAAAAVVGSVAPYASSRTVKTFAERPADAAALYGDAAGRIRSLAEEWDPEGTILSAHPLR